MNVRIAYIEEPPYYWTAEEPLSEASHSIGAITASCVP